MLNAAIDYQLTGTASIYLAGNFENVFHRKGGLNSTNTSTGDATLHRNAAGGAFKAMCLQFGVRGRFQPTLHGDGEARQSGGLSCANLLSRFRRTR